MPQEQGASFLWHYWPSHALPSYKPALDILGINTLFGHKLKFIDAPANVLMFLGTLLGTPFLPRAASQPHHPGELALATLSKALATLCASGLRCAGCYSCHQRALVPHPEPAPHCALGCPALQAWLLLPAQAMGSSWELLPKASSLASPSAPSMCLVSGYLPGEQRPAGVGCRQALGPQPLPGTGKPLWQ